MESKRTYDALAENDTLAENGALAYNKFTKNIVTEVDFATAHIIVTDTSIRQRPDDGVYKKSRSLWLNVPRGCAVAEIKSVHHDPIQLVLRGVRKFGYEEDLKTWGMMDEIQPPYERYYVTKENGECFHLTSSKRIEYSKGMHGYYLFFGSKNVHACALLDETWLTSSTSPDKWLETVRAQYSAERFGYCFALMGQFMRDIRRRNLDARKLHEFFSLLGQGVTACGEACDMDRAQHLVFYQEPTIRWFALTESKTTAPYLSAPMSLLYANPFQAREIFRNLGLDAPLQMFHVDEDQTKGPICDVDDFSTTSFLRHADRTKVEEYFQTTVNSEGAVVYVMDDKGCCIGIYKHKNHDYVAHRAVREKVRQKATTGELCHRLHNLHVPTTEEFKAWAVRFNAWVQMGLVKGTIEPNDVDAKYMELRDMFEEAYEDAIAEAVREYEVLCKKLSKLVIMLASPCQGSGKTTVGIVLQHVLKTQGISAVRLSQDDCQGNRKIYLRDVKKAYADEKVQCLILDKWNDSKNRQDYYSNCPNGKFVLLSLLHPEDDGPPYTHQVNMALNRILMERKDNHKSLRVSAMDEPKLRSILESFASKWTGPDEAEQGRLLVNLEVYLTASIADQVHYILHALRLAHLIESEAVGDGVMERGLELHREYETEAVRTKVARTKIKAPKPPKILYWCVEILDDLSGLWEKCMTTGTLVRLPKTHVTLAYKPDVKINEVWSEREGQTITLHASTLIQDDKAAALVINETDELRPHSQAELHMTWGLADDVPPAYSNELLRAYREGVHAVSLIFTPLDITMCGRIVAVRK